MLKPKQPSLHLSAEEAAAVEALIVQDGSKLRLHVKHLCRTFDFERLTPLFGGITSERIAWCLAKWFASGYARSTAITRANEFNNFCTWIRRELSGARQGSSWEGGKPSADEWGTIVLAWFQAIKARYGTEHATTCAEKANAVSNCLKRLAEEGILPRAPKLKMPLNYHFAGGHRLPIADLQSTPFLETILHEIQAKGIALNIRIPEDTGEMLVAFQEKLPRELALSENSLRSIYCAKTREYLDLIRKTCERIFLESSRLFDDGHKVLTYAHPKAAERIEAAMVLPWTEGRPILKELLPLDKPHIAGPNLLSFYAQNNNGIAFTPEKLSSSPRSYFQKLHRSLGGTKLLTALLGGDPDAIAAAALFYITEAGGNASSAVNLRPDCLEETDDPNRTRVKSVKPRAEWKPIIDTFDEREPGTSLTVPVCLRKVIEMTAIIRAGYPQLKNTLFIFRHYSAPSALSSDFLANRLRYFLRDSGNGSTRILLNSIRTSFLLYRTLNSDGDTRIAEILADHAPRTNTTRGYTSGWPTRLLYAEEIRRFKSLLEKDLIFNGLGLSEALGITATEAQNVLRRAERTGYGIQCRNPKEGPILDEDGNCTQAGVSCLGCKVRLFYVDRESVIDLLDIHSELESERPRLEANASARWEHELLPLLAFTTVAISKIERSPQASLLMDARRYLENREKK